jgi:hypothetical protein
LLKRGLLSPYSTTMEEEFEIPCTVVQTGVHSFYMGDEEQIDFIMTKTHV